MYGVRTVIFILQIRRTCRNLRGVFESFSLFCEMLTLTSSFLETAVKFKFVFPELKLYGKEISLCDENVPLGCEISSSALTVDKTRSFFILRVSTLSQPRRLLSPYSPS